MSDVAVEVSMFERIGGAVVIDRLVEAFYLRMDTLPEAMVIRAMHAPDLGPVKSVLKRYLSEWTGGPNSILPKRVTRGCGSGIWDLRSAMPSATHGCSACAARWRRRSQTAGARQELDAALTKLADWMRNQAGNPHDAGTARP